MFLKCPEEEHGLLKKIFIQGRKVQKLTEKDASEMKIAQIVRKQYRTNNRNRCKETCPKNSRGA